MEDEDEEIAEACWLKKAVCLWCCPPWPVRTIPRAVFKPPPPSYRLAADAEGKHHFIPCEKTIGCFYEVWKEKIECFFATTSRGKKIACMLFRPSPDAFYTILYSHGNCSDIGTELTFCLRLGLLIDCNVFTYDYCGYGASAGQPSSRDVFADIHCAWNAMRTRYGVLEERIILYGRSLGTVPTVEVASQKKIAAVVLLSPLTSPDRVVFQDVERSWCPDRFPGIDKLHKITCPILVMHGTNDRIINVSHGVSVFEKCRDRVDPLWVEGAGHEDIQFHVKYLERMRKFATVDLSSGSSKDSLETKISQLKAMQLYI